MTKLHFAFLFAFSAACSRAPDLKSPLEYSDPVVTVKRPGNWTLEKSETKNEGVTTTELTIEPPDGIAMIIVFTPAVPIDLEEFAANVMKGMDEKLKDDYSLGAVDFLKKVDGRKEKSNRTIAGAGREGLKLHAVISLLGQKVPITQELYSIASERSSVIVFYQSADEDLPRDRAGYDLIIGSLQLK